MKVKDLKKLVERDRELLKDNTINFSEKEKKLIREEIDILEGKIQFIKEHYMLNRKEVK